MNQMNYSGHHCSTTKYNVYKFCTDLHLWLFTTFSLSAHKLIIMDQSTIEQKIAILSHRINTLSSRFEKNLNSICANSCSVTTGHSQLCKSMSAQYAPAYTSSRDYRGRAAGLTMMLRTNAQLHQSETFILRSQLHCTFTLPAVPNRTVYMGYHCEG